MIHMKTGVADDVYDSVAMVELRVCMTAVYARQCYSKAFIFMFHNEYETGEEFNLAVKRALKYACLSKNGVGYILKPFFEIAMTKGYLKPTDVADSPLAKSALDLFPAVHAVFTQGGVDAAKTWMVKYIEQILDDPKVVAQEALNAGDINEEDVALFSFSDHDEDQKEQNGMPDCAVTPEEQSALKLDSETKKLILSLQQVSVPSRFLQPCKENDIHEQDDSDTTKEKVTASEEAHSGAEESNSSDEIEGDCDCSFCEEMRAFDDTDLSAIEASDPLDAYFIQVTAQALTHNYDSLSSDTKSSASPI